MIKFVLPLLFVSSIGLAADVTVVGEGHVGAKPDFISVTASVSSQCYPTVAEASAANTGLATQIANVLGATIAQNGKDEVLVNQGVTQYKAVIEYDQEANKNVKVCQGWAASSVVEVKLADFKKWAGLQDSLSKLIDSAAKAAQSAGKGASTTAVVNTPTPSLYPETAEKISEQAMISALKDAERKMQIIKSTDGLCVASIKSISPSSRSQPPSYADGGARAAAPAPAPGGGEGVDLSFGPQYAHSSITVVYDMVKCQ